MKIDKIGAGVGVVIFNATHKVAAGMHILREKAPKIKDANPLYYADTLIPYVLSKLKEKGVQPPFSVAVAGGASMLDVPQEEDVGAQLLKTVKELLKKEQLTIKIEHTGGSKVRSILLDIDAAKIKVD